MRAIMLCWFSFIFFISIWLTICLTTFTSLFHNKYFCDQRLFHFYLLYKGSHAIYWWDLRILSIFETFSDSLAVTGERGEESKNLFMFLFILRMPGQGANNSTSDFQFQYLVHLLLLSHSLGGNKWRIKLTVLAHTYKESSIIQCLPQLTAQE